MTAIQKIAQAIDYLVAHYQDQPELDDVAARFGYEPTYFLKLFQDHVGLSPKKFVQYLSMRSAKDFLLNGASTLDAAYQAGLSGNGRLHDLFVSCEAATPGEVKAKGRGMVIRYGFHPSVLGELMVAETERGICWLGFQVNESREAASARMKKQWANAEFIEDNSAAKKIADDILGIWGGVPGKQRLRLHLFGTNFQIQVWQAMLKIPAGTSISYQTICHAIDKPSACRAVGSAVGANPISLLIPCHRVIQSTGIIENYGWGSPRKKALLAAERATLENL